MSYIPLFPVVCRKVHVLFTLFVFVCVMWCPTHMVLCFLFCLSSSCVPNVARVSLVELELLTLPEQLNVRFVFTFSCL